MNYISQKPPMFKKIKVPKVLYISFQIGGLEIFYKKDFQFLGIREELFQVEKTLVFGLSG